MLASDLNNREFVGARNPDELLQAEFNWREVKTMFGKPVLDKEGKPTRALFVRIYAPGREENIINTPARDDHKKRFPRQWLEFQMAEGMPLDGSDIPGMSLDQWTELSDDQRRELKYLRFSTVEQIAGASDAQVQRIGMGGMGLREKAKLALRNRMDAGVKEAIDARDKRISELEGKLDRLVTLLEAKAEQKPEPSPDAPVAPVEVVEAPRPRGRPRKVVSV